MKILWFVLLLAVTLSNATYSKYGRTCKDIGCTDNEECILKEDVCTIKSRGNCGTYPACKRVNTQPKTCATYTCPPTQVCTMKHDEPRCVDSGSKRKRQVPNYNQNQSHLYPNLPNTGYQGGYTGHPGSNYPNQPQYGTTYPGQQQHGQTYPGQQPHGQTYPGQQPQGNTYPSAPLPGQTYPGQTYPGQTTSYPGQNTYPGQTYPGTQYPGQQYPGQPHTGQQYPGQQYPGQQYPGQQQPGQQYPGQQQPGQQFPGQQYPGQYGPHSPGQTYPNQPGSSTGDFYKDQTKTQGSNYGNQNYNPNTGRRYKRAMQGHGSNTNLYNSSGAYNQQGVKGGYNPIPGGNTYPIPPGYTGPHHQQSHHSGNIYPGQQSGSSYPGHQGGQNYPLHTTSSYYGHQGGANYGHQTGSNYGPSTAAPYPGQTGSQSGQNYPGQHGSNFQQHGQSFPGQQHGSHYHGNTQGSNYPAHQTRPTGSSQHSIPAGSYPNHPHSQQQAGKDFYQDQVKGSSAQHSSPTHHNQGQYPNYQGGSRFTREIQSFAFKHDKDSPNSSSGYSPNQYPNYLKDQKPYTPAPPTPPPPPPTTYPAFSGAPSGNNYPVPAIYPSQIDEFTYQFSDYPTPDNYPPQENPEHSYENYPPAKPAHSWNPFSKFFKDFLSRF